MTGRQTTQLKISMPDVFPELKFDRYRNRASKMLLNSEPTDWTEFQSSAEGATWRFRAFYEHAEGYKNHYQNLSSMEIVFVTEKYLFGTFVNAVSCIECLVYSGWSLLSYPEVSDISFTDVEKRRCNPASFLNKLVAVENSEELRFALYQLNNSDLWNACIELRNRMSHRSKIPRHLTIGRSAPSSSLAGTTSTSAILVDSNYVDDLIKWLSVSIENFCDGAYTLLSTVELRATQADNS